MELLYPRPTHELRWVVTALNGDYPANDVCVRCEALWDTGTSTTIFTKRLIDALGLRKLNIPPKDINHPLGGYKSSFYEAYIILHEGWEPIKLIVSEMPQPDIDVLIGMDIIGRGLFQVWPQDNHTVLRFELP